MRAQTTLSVLRQLPLLLPSIRYEFKEPRAWVAVSVPTLARTMLNWTFSKSRRRAALTFLALARTTLIGIFSLPICVHSGHRPRGPCACTVCPDSRMYDARFKLFLLPCCAHSRRGPKRSSACASRLCLLCRAPPPKPAGAQQRHRPLCKRERHHQQQQRRTHLLTKVPSTIAREARILLRQERKSLRRRRKRYAFCVFLLASVSVGAPAQMRDHALHRRMTTRRQDLLFSLLAQICATL